MTCLAYRHYILLFGVHLCSYRSYPGMLKTTIRTAGVYIWGRWKKYKTLCVEWICKCVSIDSRLKIRVLYKMYVLKIHPIYMLAWPSKLFELASRRIWHFLYILGEDWQIFILIGCPQDRKYIGNLTLINQFVWNKKKYFPCTYTVPKDPCSKLRTFRWNRDRVFDEYLLRSGMYLFLYPCE